MKIPEPIQALGILIIGLPLAFLFGLTIFYCINLTFVTPRYDNNDEIVRTSFLYGCQVYGAIEFQECDKTIKNPEWHSCSEYASYKQWIKK